MFNKNIKIVLAALITLWAIYQFSLFNIMNGISILFLAGIFVLLYFKNEFILLSFLQLRKQNFPGAQKWLGHIKNPSTALTTKQEGYYNYLHGIMLSQTNMTQAEKYLKKGSQVAVDGKLTNRSYEAKDKTKRYVTEILVNEILLLGAKE